MQTLGQMIDRILRIESQEDTTDASTRLAITDAINESMRNLCTTYHWGWLSTSTTVATTSGDTHLSMPSDFIALLQLENSYGTILDPKNLDRIMQFKSRFSAKGIYAYALDGTDSSGNIRLRLEPASTGDTYTVTYLAMPATLSAETDTPAGPNGIEDYLVRSARFLRAEDDEEAPNVTAGAERRALEALQRLAWTAGQPLKQLRGAIVPLRG